MQTDRSCFQLKPPCCIMRVFYACCALLWACVLLTTGVWSAKEIPPPKKTGTAKSTSKKTVWCRTRHSPRVPAQSGHGGYCKACFAKRFPREHAKKQKGRLKLCSHCGNQRQVTSVGFCKPCTKARSCNVCFAVNADSSAVTCSMCCQRRERLGATQTALALWCESCTTSEERSSFGK